MVSVRKNYSKQRPNEHMQRTYNCRYARYTAKLKQLKDEVNNIDYIVTMASVKVWEIFSN